MKNIYLLFHTSSQNENEVKLIGTYSSEENAKQAQERVSLQPGFCWDLEGFHIDKYLVDQDCWTQGFYTISTGD